jgi:hypothetical protein
MAFSVCASSRPLPPGSAARQGAFAASSIGRSHDGDPLEYTRAGGRPGTDEKRTVIGTAVESS